MEQDHYDTRSTISCSKPLIGCGIAAGIAVALVLGMLLYLLRMPVIRSVMACRSNMTELGRALERYHDVNHEYPADLIALKKEYLKDPKVLECPLDTDGGEPSYTYHRPGPDAPDDFVVLECSRHRLEAGAEPSTLKLLKNGSVTVESAHSKSREKGKR